MFPYFILYFSFLSWASAAGLRRTNAKLYARGAGVPDIQLGYYTFNGTTYLAAAQNSQVTFNIDSATSALYGNDGRFCVVSGSNYFTFVNTPGASQFQLRYLPDRIDVTYRQGDVIASRHDVFLCNITTFGATILTTSSFSFELCSSVNLIFVTDPPDPSKPTGLLPINAPLLAKATGYPDVQFGYHIFNDTTYLAAAQNSQVTFNIDSATSALYGNDGRFCIFSGFNYFMFATTPGTSQFQLRYLSDRIEVTFSQGSVFLCNITTMGGIFLTTSNIATNTCYQVTLQFDAHPPDPAELSGILPPNSKLWAQPINEPYVLLGYYTLNGTTYLAEKPNPTTPDLFNIDSASAVLYGTDGKFCVVLESNYFTFGTTPAVVQFQHWAYLTSFEITCTGSDFYLCQSTTLGATVLAATSISTDICRLVNLYAIFPLPTGPTGPTNPTGPTGPTVPTTPTRPTTPTSRTTSTGSTNRGTSTSGRTSASRTASTSPTTVRKSSAPTKPTVQETSRREPSDITAPSIAPLFAIDEDGNKISLSTIEILVNATADEIAKRENRKAIAGLTYLVADITDSSGFYIQDGRLYDADGRTVVNQDSKFITFASEGGLIGFEHSENGYLSFRGESNFYYCYLDGGNTTFKAVSLEDTGSCNVTSLILGGSADEGSTMITTVFLFTETRTITECSSTVTDCPGSSKFVHTITTTYCPDTEPGPYTITLYAAVETGDGGDIQTRTFITTIGDTSLSSSVQGSGPTEIPTFNSAGTLTRGLGLVMAACIIFLL